MMRLAGLTIAAILATGGDAEACYARIVSVTAPSLSYDPFSGDAPGDNLVVRVENTGDHNCRMRLALATQSETPRHLRGPSELAYLLTNPAGQEVRNSTTAADGVDVSLSGRRSMDVTFRVQPERLQVVPPGGYTDGVDIRLFDLEHSRSLLAQRHAILAVNVIPRAQVNFAGVSGRFGSGSVDSLDLGELSAGVSRRAFVQIRANMSVRVTLASENQGRMRHETLGLSSSVPYRAAINGSIAPLEGAGHEFTSHPPATIDGHSHALDVTITDAEARAAGLYRDLLTVTLTAY